MAAKSRTDLPIYPEREFTAAFIRNPLKQLRQNRYERTRSDDRSASHEPPECVREGESGLCLHRDSGHRSSTHGKSSDRTGRTPLRQPPHHERTKVKSLPIMPRHTLPYRGG